MRISRVVLSFFVIQLVCLAIPYAAYSQTESFDAMQYTPPKGWARSTKEGVVIFSYLDKTANRSSPRMNSDLEGVSNYAKE